MVKKTKRSSDDAPSKPSARAPASSKEMQAVEETLDNLNFEDPFEDEFEEEEGIEGDDSEDDEDGSSSAMTDGAEAASSSSSSSSSSSKVAAPLPAKQAWMPGSELAADETLEYDSSAYTMYHAIKPEWPCLTFDILRDNLGTNRTRFPHTLFAICGTQGKFILVCFV